MNALIADVIGEVALVLVVSWLFGLAARRCGQPIVVGQILAGILLGPTLLGRLPGHLTSRLFPPAELKILNVLAQIAVVLFMFVVGYELDRLFLPLFFVVTGLSLNVGSLGATAFAVLALVCAIAIAGKLVPAYASSRIGGMRPRDSAIVAVLINTRGLTELIALNLGLSVGLIDQRVFSILVLMALITTALTGPLLSLLPSPEMPPAVSEHEPAALPQAGSPD